MHPSFNRYASQPSLPNIKMREIQNELKLPLEFQIHKIKNTRLLKAQKKDKTKKSQKFDTKISINEFLQMKRRIFLTNLSLNQKRDSIQTLQNDINYEEKQLLERIDDFTENKNLVFSQFEKFKKKIRKMAQKISNLETVKHNLVKQFNDTKNRTYSKETELKLIKERLAAMRLEKEFVVQVLVNFNPELQNAAFLENPLNLSDSNSVKNCDTFLTADNSVTKVAQKSSVLFSAGSLEKRESEFAAMIENIELQNFYYFQFLQTEELKFQDYSSELQQKKETLIFRETELLNNFKSLEDEESICVLQVQKKQKLLKLMQTKNKNDENKTVNRNFSVQSSQENIPNNEKERKSKQVICENSNTKGTRIMGKTNQINFENVVEKLTDIIKKIGIKRPSEYDSIYKLKIIEAVFEKFQIENSILTRMSPLIQYKIIKELNGFGKKDFKKMDKNGSVYKMNCVDPKRHSLAKIDNLPARLPLIRSITNIGSTLGKFKELESLNSEEKVF